MITKTFQEKLEELTKQSVDNLTVQDRIFLRSRWSYLSETHKTKFQSILPKKKGTNAKK